MSGIGQLVFLGAGLGISIAFVTAAGMTMEVLRDADSAANKMVSPSMPPSPPFAPPSPGAPPSPPPPSPPPPSPPVVRRSLAELTRAGSSASATTSAMAGATAGTFALSALEKELLAKAAARFR